MLASVTSQCDSLTPRNTEGKAMWCGVGCMWDWLLIGLDIYQNLILSCVFISPNRGEDS